MCGHSISVVVFPHVEPHHSQVRKENNTFYLCQSIIFIVTLNRFQKIWHSLNKTLESSIQAWTTLETFLEAPGLKVTDWNDKQVHLKTYP